MKKKILILSSLIIITSILMASFISVNAAVYIEDSGWKYEVLSDDTVGIAGYESESVDALTIPRYYDNYSVVSVVNFGMRNNTHISSVDFMEATELSKIGMYAFYGCSQLTSVVVPTHITNIDHSVFKNCTSLKTAEFYGNNGIVPVSTFSGCSSLENVRLGANITSIQSQAFVGCSSLEYIELLETVSYIAPDAFDENEELILGVYKDTYAHQYAVNNRIDHIVLDGDKLGDVNGDGSVDILDSTEIQKYASEKIDLTPEQFEFGDINKDGFVDVMDALLVQKYVVGKYDIPPLIIRY